MSVGKWGRRDLLQTSLASEGRLSGGLFEETLQTGMTTATTGWGVCALAAHFLFATGILYRDVVSMRGMGGGVG